jgi:lipoteichoic acid synthase
MRTRLERPLHLLACDPAAKLFVAAVVLLQVILLLALRVSFNAVFVRGEILLLVSEIGAAAVIALAVETTAGKFRAQALVAAWLAVALVCYADTVYYREFQDFPTYAAAGRAKELAVVWDAIPPLMRWYDGLIAFGAAAVAGGVWLSAKGRHGVRHRRERLKGMLLAALLLATPWIINPKLSGPSTGHIWTVGKTGMLVFHAKDGAGGIVRALTKSRVAQPAEVAQVKRALQRYESFGGADRPMRPFGFARGSNVLVIQLESFQRFALGRVVGGRPVAPFLTDLARQNLYFDNFFTQVGEGRTADADLLVNCSLYPTARGVAYADYASSDYACLPSRLAAAGYSTTAFQGMSPDFWNLADMYKKVGFERFLSLNDFRGAERIGLGISDRAFLDRVAKHLATLRRPFYGFVATLTSHTPFDYPELPRNAEFYREGPSRGAAYVNALHYTDAALQTFFAELGKRGVLENTIVVVYGDHQGIGPAASGFEFVTDVSPEDRLGSFLAKTRVPLIIVLPPSLRQPRTVSAAAGEVDVAPTLLHALGFASPPWFFGKSLWSDSPRVEAMRSGAVASGDLLWLPAGEQSECFEAGVATRHERCAAMRSTGDELLRAADVLITANALGALRRSLGSTDTASYAQLGGRCRRGAERAGTGQAALPLRCG